ncbi:hypothetical protein SAY87_028653 [Trapa incisa]|uniref:Cyclin-dependent kinases regulatory subunit n=1 Tax=Trapa incisa TaxID=236973 RepID=A0AAN7KWM3_9MYRT|nr:hypothetical protein SAY87_028653 [Trapa incisa]
MRISNQAESDYFAWLRQTPPPQKCEHGIQQPNRALYQLQLRNQKRITAGSRTEEPYQSRVDPIKVTGREFCLDANVYKCLTEVRRVTDDVPIDTPQGLIGKRSLIDDKMGIQYSEKYADDTYEYRHVVLPPEVAKLLPKNRLLSENEWRAIGVQQSRGWVHYAIHRPEPHIMLFRRPLNYQQ